MSSAARRGWCWPDGYGRIDGEGQVARDIVFVAEVGIGGGVEIVFAGEQAGGVAGVADGLATAIGRGFDLAGGVTGVALFAVVGVSDRGEIALGVVGVVDAVATGIGERGKLIEG